MTLDALKGRALALWRTPLGKILAAALLLRLTGLTWGLPSYDGWDDDGVAPRDFLVGVLETYWPGHHYTYPPFHLLLLTLVAAPVWLGAIVRAPAFVPAAVIHAFIGVPTMTAMAVVARAVAVALSLGLLWNLAAIGALLGSGGGARAQAGARAQTGARGQAGGEARAGAWVAAACGLNAVLTYYSQTTNLDVPYLFWSVVALRWLVHAIVHRAPHSLRRTVVFAALAVATKDQAYGLFVLGIPAAVVAWWILDASSRSLVPAVLKELGLGVAIGLPLLLVIDGAVTNPSGWRDRIAYLLGSASQDFAYYPPTWEGRWHAARDTWLSFGLFYPWAFAVLAAAGVVVAWRTPDRARRAAGLVPLLAAISFTIAFDMSARRSEHRFALPQMVLFGVYAGLALDALQTRFGSRFRGLFALGAAPVVLYALFGCVAVDVAMLLDPRYDAERWMQDHVRPNDRVEIYGSNVQLPRLPLGAAIQRVDVNDVGGRNPILGVTEVTDRFSNVEARRPRVIVVPELWVERYFIESSWVEPSGLVLSPGQARLEGDVDSRSYFHALREGRLGYKLAHVATWTSTFWPRIDIHASLTRDVWLFERVDTPTP